MRLRAERLGALHPRPVARWPRPRCRPSSPPSTRWRPTCVVVDSIQTVFDPELASAPGIGHPGAGVRPPAGAGGQGARPGHRARRPRHQGRRPRRAPGARARGRHRAVLRGRAPPRPAPAAGRQAPVRLHRRAGPVRDDRATGLVGVPDAGAPVPRRPPRRRRRLGRRPHPRRPPAAAGRAAGAGGARARPAHAPPLGPGRRRRPPGPARWPCSSGELGLKLAEHRRVRPGRRRRPGGRAGRRPRPGPGRGLVGLRPAAARRPGGLRRDRPRRRAAPGRPDSPGAWPRRPGSGFTHAPSCPRRRPIRRPASRRHPGRHPGRGHRPGGPEPSAADRAGRMPS